ncbi:MAG: Rieske 2Fe-2S domain-containing protein [Bacteroidetes bacterium]|nr:Rieske 2Fe-2S domain-containing protein [Bacteroidota bacterium]
MDWFKIADEAELERRLPDVNALSSFDLGESSICVARLEDGYYAVADMCPHASGSLSEGEIDSRENIVCPVHLYKFSLRTGINTSGEDYFLKKYPLKLMEDGYYIGIEK